MAPVSEARFLLIRLAEKTTIILAAFGWGQLIVLGGLAIAVSTCLVYTIFSCRSISKNDLQDSGKEIPSQRMAIIPWDTLLVSAMLVLPELFFFFTNWFSSPKYLLLGSSVVAGLCMAIPLKFLHHLDGRGMQTSPWRGLALVAAALCMFLPLAAALVKLGQVQTEDGPRYIGGWMLQRISPHPDSIAARELLACLAKQPQGPGGNVVVKTSSWVMEETLSYESAKRGLQNRVVPTSEATFDDTENQVWHYSLNEYLIPGSLPIRVYVTSDASVYLDGNLLTEAVFAEATGPDFVYYQDLDCTSP